MFTSLVNGFLISSFIGKLIVAVQAGMSVYMLTIFMKKAYSLLKLDQRNRRVSHEVMDGQDVMEYHMARHHDAHSAVENIYRRTCDRLLKLLDPNARAQVGVRGGRALPASLTAHEVELVRSICDHVLDEEELKLQKKMGTLANIVKLAPMLGLLGTVWGVLDAFYAVGTSGSASIATMAPDISSALVTTVAGLVVAIPGSIAFTFLSNKIEQITVDMEGFADDLIGRVKHDYATEGGGAQ